MGDKQEVVGNGLKFVRHDSEADRGGQLLLRQLALSRLLPAYTGGDLHDHDLLRDPIARVISYYRYLLWARANPYASHEEPGIASLRNEVTTLGGNASEFLERVPAFRLLQQIYMFSERFDPSEAVEGILRCSAVCFTETFPRICDTSLRFCNSIWEKQERRFGEKVSLSEEQIELLRQRLAPEYAMIARVNDALGR